jgi:protein-S-isoprenylcysteine O-methyltransferase Ste14
LPLIEEHVKSGNWLFKYRSYLPILLFILYFSGLIQTDKPAFLFQQSNWLIFCFCVSLLGQFIRIVTVGKVPMDTSGRNTKLQKAGSINTFGIYSVVRHPLYLGNYFMWFGIFLLIPLLWVQVVFSLIYWIYYERIMIAEEEFLRGKFGNEYTDWAKNIPAFIPSFKNYKKNPMKYSFKNIIGREYTSISAMVMLFLILIFINNGYLLNNWEVSHNIKIAFLFTFIVYISMRILKKKSKLFR